MTCYHPLDAAWIPKSGQKPLIYKKGLRPKTLSNGYEPIGIPCGQCIGCRLEYSRNWAARMMHEASLFDERNSFITLTYDNKYLPYGSTLVKQHFQDFIKRLRARIYPQGVRYYQSGEYGSQCVKHYIENCPVCGPLQRPHYHAILFGFDFPDKECVGYREGYPIYCSDMLHDLWPLGIHEIGIVSFESCAYVARYVTKKQTGKKALEHYQRYIPELDTFFDLEPEYATMSLKPGIGANFFHLYKDDMYDNDHLPIPGRGVHGKPPKYYDKLFEEIQPTRLEEIKQARVEALQRSLETGPSLESREIVKLHQSAMLKRGLKYEQD